MNKITKKMKFFRYVSNFCFYVGIAIAFYGGFFVEENTGKVNIICLFASFACFALWYIIASIGWRCPVCNKRLPLRGNTHLEKCYYCGAIFTERNSSNNNNDLNEKACLNEKNNSNGKDCSDKENYLDKKDCLNKKKCSDFDDKEIYSNEKEISSNKENYLIEEDKKNSENQNEQEQKKLKKQEEKTEAQIIKEYDDILAREIINEVCSAFIMIFAMMLNFFEFGRYIWAVIMIILVLYNGYFFFTKYRCPNCHHLFCGRRDFNLKKCPYCGVKLRN